MNQTPEAPPPPPIPGVPPETEKPPTNGLAVASLVCGIFGWVLFIGGVLAVVMGVVARRQIRESTEPQRGAGLALVGIIVGAATATISAVTIYAIYVA